VPHQGDSEILNLSGRGVCSLAPEPSYFGFILLLYFYISLLINERNLSIISILGIVFLAQSFTVIFCLLISIIIYYSFKNTLNFILFLVFIFLIPIIGVLIIPTLDVDTRSIALVQGIILDGFSSTIEGDASATGRLFHITYPISQSFNNFFNC
jgi:hypothetical protein